MIWLRINAWFTNGEPVWLQDHDGEVVASIARRDPWGEVYAYRWWDIKTRRVTLNPDGTCSNGGYVKRWKRVNENPFAGTAP